MGPVRKLPRVLILWGVPGVGKSTFAAWLVKEKGFAHVDTDVGGGGGSRAAKAWRAVLEKLGTPEQLGKAKEFMKVAPYNPQPVVVEYGMFAYPEAIALLRTLRDWGADTWWFDGERNAALAAWQEENVKSSRPYVDAQWHNVVRIIDANMAALQEFFGTDMTRTIEAGPTHVPPEDTFKAMFGEGT
jgi:hypothetical protein